LFYTLFYAGLACLKTKEAVYIDFSVSAWYNIIKKRTAKAVRQNTLIIS